VSVRPYPRSLRPLAAPRSIRQRRGRHRSHVKGSTVLLTLADPLEHARRLHAKRVAVVDGDVRLDYGELFDRCERLAAGLQNIGVGPGDRVAFLSANSHRYFEAFCAIPAHGIVIVPLNTRLATPE